MVSLVFTWTLKITHSHATQNDKYEQKTPTFDDGVHPSLATSPSSNFIVWAFLLASIVLTLLSHASNALGTYSNEFKTFKSIRNDFIYSIWLPTTLGMASNTRRPWASKIFKWPKTLVDDLFFLWNLLQWVPSMPISQKWLFSHRK